MDTINLLTMVLMIVLVIMVILLIALGIVFAYSKINKKEENENKPKEEVKNSKTKKFKDYRTGSVLDFMEFDTVVDNMISQKDGKRYVMVVECQGINYDLMSEAEKNGVEDGFVQFLNTLRHPVQIYTQTRTVNLDNSIQTYKEKIKEIEMALEKQEIQYKQMQRAETYTEEQLNKAYFELTKQRNLYEYGKDIIYSTEKMSLNKNVLNKKYYVVVPYYVEELGENQFDKQEQRNLAFSELYTRAQSIIRTLAVCGINARVMDSNELVELLYVAYNRDEAEVYGLEKALKAGYDELYSTAPDVVDKQMKVLNEQIEQEALELATAKVNEARSEKQKALEEKKANKRDLIAELAQLIIEENTQIIGKDIAEEAINKIDTNEEGGTENVKEKAKRTRKRKTA